MRGSNEEVKVRITYGLTAKILVKQNKTKSRTGNANALYGSRPWKNASEQF